MKKKQGEKIKGFQRKPGSANQLGFTLLPAEEWAEKEYL